MSPRKALRIIDGADEIEEPTFRATASEKAAIKRFLDFALKDLKFQFEGLRHELASPTTADRAAQLDDLQTHAVIIRKYVEALKSGLDAMEQVN
jgi:hypothetical protein